MTGAGWRHGTRYSYEAKICRCDKCREWKSERNRQQYARRKNQVGGPST